MSSEWTNTIKQGLFLVDLWSLDGSLILFNSNCFGGCIVMPCNGMKQSLIKIIFLEGTKHYNIGLLFLFTVPVTLGATVGTLMAFIVISVILLLAFFIGCRHCCASPAANQVALSRSSESLLRQQRESEEQLAPPRYSVVVSLQQDGEAIESMLREDTSERIGGVLMLQPPSYEDALRELAARGIILNTEKLKPMPPAYRDLPYTITSATADGPAVLELKTISSRVSSAEVV